MANTRNLRHGHLSLLDGQATPNSLAIDIDDGNLSFDENTPVVTVKNRGALDHLSKGEEMPVTLSFTVKFSQYGNRTSPSIVAVGAGGAVTGFSARGFMKNAGALLTTRSGRNDVFSCKLVFLIDNPALSGDANETLTFDNFVLTNTKFAEGADTDTLVFTGTALITTPASVRA